MSFLIAFVAAPWLAARGIYNPQVIDRHHRCLAEPGSFDGFIVREPRQLLQCT
jgi:hypothetical protein